MALNGHHASGVHHVRVLATSNDNACLKRGVENTRRLGSSTGTARPLKLGRAAHAQRLTDQIGSRSAESFSMRKEHVFSSRRLSKLSTCRLSAAQYSLRAGIRNSPIVHTCCQGDLRGRDTELNLRTRPTDAEHRRNLTCTLLQARLQRSIFAPLAHVSTTTAPQTGPLSELSTAVEQVGALSTSEFCAAYSLTASDPLSWHFSHTPGPALRSGAPRHGDAPTGPRWRVSARAGLRQARRHPVKRPTRRHFPDTPPLRRKPLAALHNAVSRCAHGLQGPAGREIHRNSRCTGAGHRAHLEPEH